MRAHTTLRQVCVFITAVPITKLFRVAAARGAGPGLKVLSLSLSHGGELCLRPL